jgi:hypothetical protein
MHFGKAWNGFKGQKKFYWHWSNHGWEMNFKLEGYNDVWLLNGALRQRIPFQPPLYHQGWAMGNKMGITWNSVIFNYNGAQEMWVLCLGTIFLLRFRSFAINRSICWLLGIDKIILKSLINIALQTQNKNGRYSDKCWGLTASYSRTVMVHRIFSTSTQQWFGCNHAYGSFILFPL